MLRILCTLSVLAGLPSILVDPNTPGTYRVTGNGLDVSVTVASTTATPTPPAAPKLWVTAYYPGYQSTMYPPAAVDFSSLTHLVVGAALPRADGTLDTSLYLGTTQGPALARDLTTRARAAGRKSLLMLGGSGATAWQAAAAPARLAAFIQNIRTAVSSMGFDGVDLDWEPIAAADQPQVLLLVQALRAASPDMIITVPISWVGSSAKVDPWFSTLAPLVDQLNLMSYQMAGTWPGWQSWHSSALVGEGPTTPSSVSSSANAYAAAGVPKSKIGIGIGFYGSCWAGVTGPRQATAGAAIKANDNVMTLARIVGTYVPAGQYQWDAAAQAGSLTFPAPYGPDGCAWISYEDDASIAAKGQWVKANGFGGAIIWTVNQGYAAASGTNPPLAAVRRAFLAP